jgi:hypothetical protein
MTGTNLRVGMSRARLVGAVVAALLLPPASAHAADPGRWRLTGFSRIPLVYYQGVTTDRAGHLFFDGVFAGLYRTDLALGEQARNDLVIPPSVTASEGYNHIGDIAWDAREGGRVLLPLECYYPGRPGDANTCHTGSFGVADPVTLAWRYYVKLDPAEIPKAMWVEESPDGKLLWTSAGNDLLAYRAADVSAAAAGPIHSVRRLPGAVPPSGLTGAPFVGRRLFVSGQSGDTFQVWSIDTSTGARRLEIERHIAGESEGLVTVRALGGTLHWIVTPVDPEGNPPTYGPDGNVLLHFARRSRVRPAMRLRARPRILHADRRTTVRFRVTRRLRGRRVPVAHARVRFAGHHARTSRRGVARIALRPVRTGRRVAHARHAGLRPAHTTVFVVRRGS